MDDWLMILLRHDLMEQLRRYIEAGRSLASLSDADLANRWKSVWMSMASDPFNGSLRTEALEISAELEIRGQTPPTEMISEEIRVLAETASKNLDRMRREPGGMDRAIRELEEQFDSLQDEVKTSSEN